MPCACVISRHCLSKSLNGVFGNLYEMGALRLRAPADRRSPGWNVVGLAGTPAMALPRLNGVRAGGSSAGGWEYVE
eukprot:6459109-Prymnesium_polylepis.1